MICNSMNENKIESRGGKQKKKNYENDQKHLNCDYKGINDIIS